MGPWHIEILPLRMNLAHTFWNRILVFLDVFYHCIIPPAPFPKFINDNHVFICDTVALIMFDLDIETIVPCSTVEIRSNNIPGDPPFSKMIDS